MSGVGSPRSTLSGSEGAAIGCLLLSSKGAPGSAWQKGRNSTTPLGCMMVPLTFLHGSEWCPSKYPSNPPFRSTGNLVNLDPWPLLSGDLAGALLLPLDADDL